MSLLANQRARSATEIVDASVQFYRAHAIPLLTIAAIVTIPPALVGFFAPPGFAVLVNLVGNLLLSVGGGAASVYAIIVMTEGEAQATYGEAFRRVSRRIGRVIAAQIVFGLAVIVGSVLLVIPGLIFAVRFSLATTIAAVEGTDSNKSLNRSWALTKGHAMHAFKALAIGLGVMVLVVLGGSFLIGLLAAPLGLDDSTTTLLVEPLFTAVMPFIWMLVTMLYIDLRVRVEGADIEAMVAVLPPSQVGIPTH
jgi:hypothetical protein